MPLIQPAVGLAIALALAALSIYTSYALAHRVLGRAPVSVRWCGASVICLWLLFAVFHVLAPLRLFRPSCCLAAWVLLSLTAWRVLDRDLTALRGLRRDLQAFHERVRQAWGSPDSWIYIIGFGFLSFIAAQEIVTPPLDWDSLTGHLFMAGKWVQNGGLFSLDAQFAWGQFRYFPHNGEVLSAWFMLPFHGDRMLGLANLPAWGLCMLGFYALCRHYGVRARHAALGSVTLGFTPAIFAYAPTSYVEPSLLAELLCGALFAVRSLRDARTSDVALAFAAFGCALGTKLTAIPIFMAAAAFVSFKLLLGRGKPRLRNLALALVLAAAACAPWYVRTWVEQGSPTYPYPLRVGGVIVSRGSATFAAVREELYTKMLVSESEKRQAVGMARRLYGDYSLAPFKLSPLAVGPILFVLLLAAGPGFLAVWRREGGSSLFLLAAVLLSVYGYFSGDIVVIRYFWPVNSCRFLQFPVSMLLFWTVLLLNAPGWLSVWVRRGLLLGIAINFALCIPEGFWGSPMLVIQRALVALVLAGAAAWGAWGAWVAWTSARSRTMPTVAVALLSLLVLGIWVVVSDARDRQRHLFYAGSYDLHDFPHAGAAAWKYCDDPTRPRRIACAAGWDGTGHNWLWYPLLGRDLQNEVTYVPVTVSGQVVEYGQTSELQKQADFVSWLRRLMKERIDTVVCLPPEPIEVVWARQHPDVLKQVSGEDETHVYVLQTAAAEGLLAGQASGKDTSETGAVLGQREKRTLQSTNPP